MKRQALRRVLWIFLLAGIFPGKSAYGVTAWNGVVAADVLDDDINITGNVLLGQTIVPGPAVTRVTVHAAAVDIAVTTAGAFNITANDDPGVPVVLDLVADAGRTITFDLADTLYFRGGLNRLMVTFSGAGNLKFRCADGGTIGFTPSQTAGAYFVVLMDQVVHTPAVPHVTFERRADSDNDSTILVSADSFMGFVATNPADAGIIAFNAHNLMGNTGRLKLEVIDTGAIAVQSYQLNVAGVPFSLSDIAFTTLLGTTAEMRVIDSGISAPGWSGLFVVNRNLTFPNLRSNPWLLNPAPAVGVQYGFVVGQNGLLSTDDQCYFDYVAAIKNFSPAPNPALMTAVLDRFTVNGILPQVNTLVKERNASALIVDGLPAPYRAPAQLVYPTFDLRGTSKFYFRSGCDSIATSQSPEFLVTPANQFTAEAGYGSIVLDVEGTMNVLGDSALTNAINILSIQEAVTGGSALIEGTETNFKLRTYTDDDGLLQYGKGCFLINGRMNLDSVSLQHTDELHDVYEKNIDQQSEATYIGGESYHLAASLYRPTIAFHDARFLFHTSLALAGVDCLTPSRIINATPTDNISAFQFYYNGRLIDQGTGRNLVLGTDIGATAVDFGTIVDRDAHFDVRQENNQANATTITASVTVAPNNEKVVQGLNYDILTQYALHSFFLAHGTNISLGINGTTAIDPETSQEFAPNSWGTLLVAGDFISFESQGGALYDIAKSVQEGQGGIFVDNFGRFELFGRLRMSLAAMVGTAFNGTVVLPEHQVYMDDRIGVTNSELNLANVSERTIIPENTSVSDFTLNWKYTVRDPSFIPYELPITPSMGNQQPAIAANMAAVPTVLGYVGQLQIMNSRIGDCAHILVDGGIQGSAGQGVIDELIFLKGNESGVAPTGVVIMKNDAIVGLGSAKRNVDSLQGNMVLGINGVTLMPDGNAEVILNEDVVIDNVCHIVPGVNFGVGEIHQLVITSEVPRMITVETNGVLDLSLLTTPNMQVVVGGLVHIVFKPGSRILLGGGQLTITDNAVVTFMPQAVTSRPVGTTLASTDDMRVKINGIGEIVVKENATVEIFRNALVGIENGGAAIGSETLDYATNIVLTLKDSAQVNIGTLEDFGGGLQIGNTADYSQQNGYVDFTLNLQGIGAKVNVGSQGFLGLGVGIVDKQESAPDTWLVQPTYNTRSIMINLTQGVLSHNEIYLGSNKFASLIALGAVSTGFDMSSFDVNDIQIRGGGNIALVSGANPIAPVVGTVDGLINATLSVGIMGSKDVLTDTSRTVPPSPATPAQAFTALKANDYFEQVTKRAELGQDTLGTLSEGFIKGDVIVRYGTNRLLGFGATQTDPTRSLEAGIVGMALGTDEAPRFTAITY